MLALITAVTHKGIIGNTGKLPWNLPQDLKNFKRLTKHNVVLMGRKTFESLGNKPLPNRINVVLSKSYPREERVSPSLLKFNDYRYALNCIKKVDNCLKIFVIGGAEIYKQCINYILPDYLYITRIYKDFEGDIYLPKLPYKDYELVDLEGKEENGIPFDFEVWQLRN